MEECGEECGVAAVLIKNTSVLYKEEQASYVLYNLLSQLQHRGQTSAGIAVFSPGSKKRLRSEKAIGRISNLFKTENIVDFKKMLANNLGVSGIGHVRYATSNVSDDSLILEEEAQPFLRRHGRPWKKFAIAFNGHLTNYEELKKELIENHGYILDTDVDTEVLMHLIALELKNFERSLPASRQFSNIAKPDLFEVFEKVIAKLDGSFCFVYIDAEGDMIIARDKLGFRPLVIGENADVIAVSSESNAFTKVGIENFRSIEPGEIVWIMKSGEILSKKMKQELVLGPSDKLKENRCAHCHFEYVYFSDACSVNDNLSVDAARGNLGRELAKEEKLKSSFSEGSSRSSTGCAGVSDWIVVPVPSTAIPAAMAYSKETGVPISLALVKNDVGRGFINSTSQRNTIMNSKYNVITPRTEGKKIILFDDSIVRGETSARIIKLFREKGKAREVHLRVTEMPLKFPCCYGVDFHSLKELVAGNFKGSQEEAEKMVAEKIGADSMGYLSFEGLKSALGDTDSASQHSDERGNSNKYCFACLTGNYPTQAGKKFLDDALKELEKK